MFLLVMMTQSGRKPQDKVQVNKEQKSGVGVEAGTLCKLSTDVQAQ